LTWHLIKYQQPYDPSIWAAAEEKVKAKRFKRLQQTAASFGMKLVCASTA
jgi:hypothetical protein